MAPAEGRGGTRCRCVAWLRAAWPNASLRPAVAQEVFGFVTPDAIQTLKKSHRGNLETLIRQVRGRPGSEGSRSPLACPTATPGRLPNGARRSPPQAGVLRAGAQLCTPPASAAGHRAPLGARTRSLCRIPLGQVRVLTRIMPFLLSDGEEEGSFVHELFWTVPEHRTVPLADATRPASGEGGAEGDPQEGETAGATQAAAEETKGGDPSQEEGKGESRSTPPASRDPLGRRLVHAVFQLLFLPGLSAEGRAAEFLRRGLGEDGTAPRRPMTTAEEAVAAGNRDPEIRMLAEAADNMPKREIVWCVGASPHRQPANPHPPCPRAGRYPGVAFHVVHEPFVSSTTKSARSEVLRLLLVLLSSSMYSVRGRAARGETPSPSPSRAHRSGPLPRASRRTSECTCGTGGRRRRHPRTVPSSAPSSSPSSTTPSPTTPSAGASPTAA